jgi:hypothetical protein
MAARELAQSRVSSDSSDYSLSPQGHGIKKRWSSLSLRRMFSGLRRKRI